MGADRVREVLVVVEHGDDLARRLRRRGLQPLDRCSAASPVASPASSAIQPAGRVHGHDRSGRGLLRRVAEPEPAFDSPRRRFSEPAHRARRPAEADHLRQRLAEQRAHRGRSSRLHGDAPVIRRCACEYDRPRASASQGDCRYFGSPWRSIRARTQRTARDAEATRASLSLEGGELVSFIARYGCSWLALLRLSFLVQRGNRQNARLICVTLLRRVPQLVYVTTGRGFRTEAPTMKVDLSPRHGLNLHSCDMPREAETVTATLQLLNLTPRQRQVLMFLLRGYSNKLIARALNLSVETIKDHVRGVLRALKVSSRTQAVLAVTDMSLSSAGEVLNLLEIGVGCILRFERLAAFESTTDRSIPMARVPASEATRKRIDAMIQRAEREVDNERAGAGGGAVDRRGSAGGRGRRTRWVASTTGTAARPCTWLSQRCTGRGA